VTVGGSIEHHPVLSVPGNDHLSHVLRRYVGGCLILVFVEKTDEVFDGVWHVVCGIYLVAGEVVEHGGSLLCFGLTGNHGQHDGRQKQ